MRVGHILSQADRICDYIPVISTLSNAVDLVAKAIFSAIHINCLEGDYANHLRDKSALRCALLLIPVIGNVVTLLLSSAPKVFKLEELQNLKGEALQRALEEELVNECVSERSFIDWKTQLFPNKSMVEIAEEERRREQDEMPTDYHEIRQRLFAKLALLIFYNCYSGDILANDLPLVSSENKQRLLNQAWLFTKNEMDEDSYRINRDTGPRLIYAKPHK